MSRKTSQDFGTDRVAKPTESRSEITQQSPALATIVHIVDGQELQVFPLLANEFIIGRLKVCGIYVSGDSSISRKHARIYREGVVFLVEDLGSSNGTFLNGEKVLQPTELRVSDKVEVGDQVFRFKRQA